MQRSFFHKFQRFSGYLPGGIGALQIQHKKYQKSYTEFQAYSTKNYTRRFNFIPAGYGNCPDPQQR